MGAPQDIGLAIGQAGMFSPEGDYSPLYEFKIGEDEGVIYPPKGSYRYLASLTRLYANSDYGLPSLHDRIAHQAFQHLRQKRHRAGT